MADNNMPKNDTLVGGDSENFMRLMNRALARIEKVAAATNKANESLKEYANTFDELNSKLEELMIKEEKFHKENNSNINFQIEGIIERDSHLKENLGSNNNSSEGSVGSFSGSSLSKNKSFLNLFESLL